MKRIIAVLLTLILALSLIPTVAFAEGNVTFTVTASKSQVTVGDEVDVTVAVSAIEKSRGVAVYLNYDKAKVQYVSGGADDTTTLGDASDYEHIESTAQVGFVAELKKQTDVEASTLMTVKFKAIADGEATFSLCDAEAPYGEGKDGGLYDVDESSTAKVTINKPIVKVTGVTLNKSTMSLVATAEETLTATVAPENATNKAVTWSTSNDKVAAVVNGKVTAVAPGEAVITATTADGGFTATCKVTVTEKPCEHPDAKLTKVDAKEATCTEPGNAECWKCGECGKYLSADKSTVQDTIFGYAPALGHEYGNLVAAVAPTCTVNGNVAYYQCSRCEKYFNADKNPITSIVAPATGHVIQHHAAVAATCVAEGSKEYWSCASCKKNFSDAKGKTLAENVTLPVDTSAHTIVNVPAKPHTCTEDGIIAHYKCTGCGKLFSDKAGENKITNIVDPAAHKLTPVAEKPSTCRVNGTGAYNKCEVCGKMFDKDTNKEITAVPVLELAAHTWDDVWHANSTGHYHECTVCGIAGDVTAHTPGAEATETTAQTCTICGYIIKPATSHKEHTKGNLMSDATSHWYACTGCSEQLEKANHTVTSWTVDKAATTTEEGLRHGNCSVCQHVVYEKLAKINNTPTTPSKPGRPSGTKTVQSGKTFDAGVGVYVGLSILSLTGSAVVIGKKRKTR